LNFRQSLPRLFVDFIKAFASVGDIFAHRPNHTSILAVAGEVGKRPYSRDRLRAALIEQAEHFSSGEKTLANIDRLQDPGIPVVLTNLEPNILCGPLTVLLKAVTVARLTADLSEDGLHAVPMIWIKNQKVENPTEDAIKALDSSMKIINLRFAGPMDQGRSLAALDSLKSDLKGHLGPMAAESDAFRFFEECRGAAGDGIQAWGHWLSGLLADWGIVLVDSSLGAMSVLTEGPRHEIQEKRSQATPLLNHQRARLNSAGYAATGESEADPAPLQSGLLPVIASVLEPAEIYHRSLIEPWFRLLGLPTPVWWPAARVTIADRKSSRFLGKYDLTLKDLFPGRAEILGRILPLGEERAVQRGLVHIEGLIQRAMSELCMTDAEDMPDRFKSSETRMKYQIESLRQKYVSARLRRTAELQRQIGHVCNLLVPEGRRQEEQLGWFYFLLHFAEDLPEILYNQIENSRFEHQLLHWG